MKAKCYFKSAKWAEKNKLLSNDEIENLYRTATKIHEQEKYKFYYAECLKKMFFHYKNNIIRNNAIHNYGQTLINSQHYYLQAMASFLYLWLDYPKDNQIEESITFYIEKILPEYFYLCLSQIMSCVNKTLFFENISNIIHKLLRYFPQQCLWSIIANFQSKDLKTIQNLVNIYNSFITHHPEFVILFNNLKDLCKRLRNLAKKKFRLSYFQLSILYPEILENLPSFIIVPCNKNLTLPNSYSKSNNFNTNLYPDLPKIVKLQDTVYVFNSKQAPKKICFLGSDGINYHFFM